DTRFPITQRHLFESRCVKKIKMGVGLFNTNDFPFPYKIDIEDVPDLGFEVNFPNDINETAIFYAIRNGHKDGTRMLIERGASLDVISTEVLCPCSMFCDSQPEILNTTRKGKRLTPQTIRARMGEEEEEGEDEDEPITGKRSDNIGVQNDEYFACAFVHNCAKRLRRSERDASILDRVRAIENLASGKGKGLGGLLLQAAEVNARKKGSRHSKVAGADQSSIDAIKAVGGSVTIVYMERVALRAHIKPWKFEVLPRTARPTLKMVTYLEKMKARGCHVRYIKPLWLIEEEKRLQSQLRELKTEDAASTARKLVESGEYLQKTTLG
ncbi:rplO, partial [Symbiodinium necroappetens]